MWIILLFISVFFDFFALLSQNYQLPLITIPTNINLYFKLIFPSFCSYPWIRFNFIAAKDIILPGILICFGYRIDKLQEKKNYFLPSLKGFIFGLFLTVFLYFSFEKNQYLILLTAHSTLIPMVFKAIKYKEFKKIWLGKFDKNITFIEEIYNSKDVFLKNDNHAYKK